MFSHLQKEYGDVFLNGVGLLVSSIEPTMGTAQKALVSKYMKKSKDLYPDLIMFPKRVVDLELDCLKRFENLSTFACPLILIEWKFTNSFPSMPIKALIQDAAKLEIIGYYVNQTLGKQPQLLQVIFNFTDIDKPDFSERVIKRYENVALEIPNVHTVILSLEGTILTLKEPNNSQ